MNMGTIWTVLGVIAAVVIAFILVQFLFTVMFWIFKLAIVAVVALIVFGILRAIFRKRSA